MKKRQDKSGVGAHPAARSLIERMGTQWKDHCSASDRTRLSQETAALISLGAGASAASRSFLSSRTVNARMRGLR